MPELPFFIQDYLKGKTIYPVARRILDFLFTISITSFLFETFYFKYEWVDISNYKRILDFLIKGEFFVPFCLFTIVYYMTSFIANGIFLLVTESKSPQLVNFVMRFKAEYNEMKLIKAEIKRTDTDFKKTIIVSQPWWVRGYQRLKNNIPSEQWIKMKSSIREQQMDFRNDFKLTFKTLLVISIYFHQIAFFGWLLYTLVTVLLIALLIAICSGYLLIEIMLVVFREIKFEADILLENDKSNPAS